VAASLLSKRNGKKKKPVTSREHQFVPKKSFLADHIHSTLPQWDNRHTYTDQLNQLQVASKASMRVIPSALARARILARERSRGLRTNDSSWQSKSHSGARTTPPWSLYFHPTIVPGTALVVCVYLAMQRDLSAKRHLDDRLLVNALQEQLMKEQKREEEGREKRPGDHR
jgi:hypothetical protein